MHIKYISILLVLALSTLANAEEDRTPDSTSTPAAAAPKVEAPAKAEASVKNSEARKPEPEWTGEAAVIRKDLAVLFEESKKVTDSDKAVRQRSRNYIETSFNWDHIAEECLGKKLWEEKKGSQRETFSKLLKDVIQRTAFGRLEAFWKGAEYRFDKITVEGDKALAGVDFYKDSDKVHIDYKLEKLKDKWTLYDLGFDENFYAATIHTQITGFLKAKKENTFPKFLEQFKKRRDELAEKKNS